MYTLVCGGLEVFYSSIGLTFVPWLKRSFFMREIFFNSRILRDSFFIGLS